MTFPARTSYIISITPFPPKKNWFRTGAGSTCGWCYSVWRMLQKRDLKRLPYALWTQMLGVLAIANVSELNDEELHMAFWTGKNFRYTCPWDCQVSWSWQIKGLVFNTFTGCDTVSAFATRGRKTAWDTWNPDDMATVWSFTILLYDHTSSQLNSDQAHLELFIKKGRGTKDALVQHLKRAVYQGGHCWGQALEVAPNMPSPTDWGWMDPSDWRPLWSTLPQASQSIIELLSCG